MPRLRRLGRLGLLALLAGAASIATVPAGAVTPQPALAEHPGAEPGRFVVRGFEVLGTQQLAPAELQALLAPQLGTETDLAGLQAAAERVAQALRRRGLALASAYVPPQEVHDGVVRLVVVEGRLGRVRLQNASRLGEAALLQLQSLAAAADGGTPDLAALQQALQRLSERTGVIVSTALQPGASFGTADLEVVVQDGRRVEVELGLDNHGQRHTGRWRLRTEVRGAGVLAETDSVSLSLLSAGPGLQHGRLAWQLAPAPAPAWRLGLAASTLHYALRGELSALEARGRAGSLSAYALHPLHRSEQSALQLQAVWEIKTLVDELGAGAVSSRRQARLATLGLSGERADGGFGLGGRWQGAASLVAGRLDLDAATAALDAAGAGLQGRYLKLLVQASRLQPLGRGWEATLRAQLQAADGNLDGSEKLALGGPGAVRALETGSSAVDQGWLATLELRRHIAPGWTLGGFVDAAAGHGRRKALPGDDNRRRARGHGLLLEATHGAWQLSLQAAWPGGEARTAARGARAHAQLSWRLP
jgi:hemolysin activation/secretion protein